MKCEYCNTEGQTGRNCEKCGAELPQRSNSIECAPFFYNGYLVVYIRHPMRDALEVQFWLGKELQKRFEVTGRWIEENTAEAEDLTLRFWDMFRLAKGEEEVLYWKAKNEKPYSRFEIRCIDERPSYIIEE